MKNAALYEEAKRMYVTEGMSVDAIVELLQNKVSRKTIYNWKGEHNWDEQRRQYLGTTADIRTELLEITRNAIREAKVSPTPHNIYAVVKALSALKIISAIPGTDTADPSAGEESQKDPDLLSKKVLEVLGL